jgi:beta-galactosidase
MEPDAGQRGATVARREFLRAAAAGAGGVASWALLAARPTAARAAAGPGGGTAPAVAHGPAGLTIPFGTGWLFGPATPGSGDPGFDDSGLAQVTLPHTVTPLSWHEWDPATWESVWVYRKHFGAPPLAGRLRAFLDFEGAMTSAALTLNGEALPGHTGGYLPFTCEITDQLMPSGNVLAVTLDATFNQDVPPDRPAPFVSAKVDFWQPGGIYRGVHLRLVPQVFLADVFAKPVNVLDPAGRQVVVQCTVDAAVVPEGSLAVVTSLYDGGTKLATAQVPVTPDGPGLTVVTATLDGLTDITLWDTGNPKLYTVVSTLTVNGFGLHDFRVRTGFREASFGLDGFFLNGQRLKLFGLNRHQFFPFAGGAVPARGQRRDAEILRQDMNCNIVRCSHYPQAEAFYDACDELGLMVWEEAPGWGYLGDDAWKAHAYADIGNMIVRDRNHPSIVIWGARLNETPDDTAFYTSTNELAHSLDDSRPTVGAMTGGLHRDTNYQQDVFGQNDYTSTTGPDGVRQPGLMAPRTDLPYLVSEAVGALSGPARFYRRTDTQDVQQGQASAHARVHNIAGGNDRYCGLIGWAGFDYPSGNGNQFEGVKTPGVIDEFRIPKPGAAIYQSQVDPRTRPVIQPAFYWDFGPTSPVTALSAAMICANLGQLEIYVGGDHYATALPDTADFPHLTYPPFFADFTGVDGAGLPELRIDGYLGGTLVASRSFSGDPATDVLAVTADDHTLAADGADQTRVEFRAADAFGAPRPYVTGDVTLSVTGPAVLVGDNPFAFADTGGAGAVWVRTLPGRPGKVTVTASHPGLGSAAVTIRVLPALAAPPVSRGTVPGLVPPAPAAARAGQPAVEPAAGHG